MTASSPVINNNSTEAPQIKLKPPPAPVLPFFLFLLAVLLTFGAVFAFQKGFFSRYLSSGEPISESPDNISPSFLPVQDLPMAHNDFGLDIFKTLYQQEPDKNLFISPTSISLALSMAYNGADGRTKEAMADTMHIAGLDLDKLNQTSLDLQKRLENADPKVEINIANAIWGDAGEGIEFKQQFVDDTENYYKAKVKSLNFSQVNIVNIINSWVDQKTKGKIPKIINDDDFVVALVNAIYFKGDWTNEFDSKLTKEKNFTLYDGSVKKHPLMEQKRDDFSYLETDDFQAVNLPYGENKILNMYVFLPKKGLDSFLGKLDLNNWQNWLSQFKTTEGIVLMPKFKIEYEKELKQILSQLGMSTAFGGGADFSRMTASSLVIDKVIHKTYVEVDEKGTEAAAVTAVLMQGTAIMDKPSPPSSFYMEVNKPFFFVIVDNQSQEILFMGTVKTPSL